MQFIIDNISTEKIKKLVEDKIYGCFPERPLHLETEIESECDSFAAGRAVYRKQKMLLEMGEGDVLEIPFVSVIPVSDVPVPAIISLNFESHVPNKFLPAEEIVNRGYAIFSLCIDDLAQNNADFKSGICQSVIKSRRKKNSPGKMVLWAYGAELLCDYASNLNAINKSAVGVSGHGVAAKAALLVAAFSDKVSYVISNDALTIVPPLSSANNIGYGMVYDFPYLFCPAFVDEPINEEHMLLLSLCKGKKILVGCSADDIRSNYHLEYDMLMRSSLVENNPKSTTNNEKTLPIPFVFEKQDISYHLRGGKSYFSRDDWNIYLDFLDKNFNREKK